MRALMNVIRLMTIVVWVGGLVFFAFVVAPVAFHVLPSPHLAGQVVAGTLGVLNRIGTICGALFICATGILCAGVPRNRRRLGVAEIVLAIVMMAACSFVQWSIVPRMEQDRIAAAGDIDAAQPGNPARLDFERLHPLSEKIEGAALILGLIVVVILGIEARPGYESA